MKTLLVLVGIRLGISLVLVVVDLRLLLTILVLTVFALAVLAFSTLALEHGRQLSGHLFEGVESTRMERQMVPDRRVLEASLEHSLPHVVSHGRRSLRAS